MVHGSRGARPYPWPWDEWGSNKGNGTVYIRATGPLSDEIIVQVRRVCGELSLPCEIWNFPLFGAHPQASALIIYDGANDALIGSGNALAPAENIPLIFICEQDKAFDEFRQGSVRDLAYHPDRGVIPFAPWASIAGPLRSALAELFSALDLVEISRTEWDWAIYAGLRERQDQIRDNRNPPEPPRIIKSDEWRERKRALVTEAEEKCTRARDRAQQELDLVGDTLPVNVKAIAESHGMRVGWAPLAMSSGQLSVIGDVGVIKVRPNESPQRQRFTIAHEVGHYLFHHGPVCYRRLPDAPWVYRPKEMAADAFANELLMPAAPVRAAFETACAELRRYDEVVTKLAKLCEVSEGAMKERLRFLDLRAC